MFLLIRRWTTLILGVKRNAVGRRHMLKESAGESLQESLKNLDKRVVERSSAKAPSVEREFAGIAAESPGNRQRIHQGSLENLS